MSKEKQIADTLDQISELFASLAGTFRGAGSGEKDSAGDGPAPAPVSGRRKPATKAVAKPEADSADDDEGGTAEATEDEVREALKELAASKGKTVMAAALKSVGAGRLSDVDESQYGELMAEVNKLMQDKPKATAKGKAKKADMDYDTLEAKFKELVESDKAVAKTVLKSAGLKKLSDIDTEDADAMQELYDNVEAALEGEEDSLV